MTSGVAFHLSNRTSIYMQLRSPLKMHIISLTYLMTYILNALLERIHIGIGLFFFYYFVEIFMFSKLFPFCIVSAPFSVKGEGRLRVM